MSPRVVYVGNFASPHSTENDLRKSFEQLAWDVDTWQEGEFLTDVATNWGACLERCSQADLVMHTMTQGSYGPAEQIIALWDELRERDVPTASYHLDRFYGLKSVKDSGPQRHDLPRVHPMFKVADVFTADGDHDEDFARDGVNHHFLRPGVLAEEAHDSEAYPPWVGRWDVAFVGSSGYHPEWPHRPELVNWLRNTYGDRFIHIGPGSSQTVTDDGGRELDRLRGHWLNRFYASVPVTVGDSCLLRRDGRYTSDRPYECWGRGGFLIHPGVYGLVEAIGDYPGHSWNPGDWDNLRFEIDRCVADPAVREAYRTRLAAEVRAHHTYTHRVQSMLDTIGLWYQGKPEPEPVTVPVVVEEPPVDEPAAPPSLADARVAFERMAELAEHQAATARAWAEALR